MKRKITLYSLDVKSYPNIEVEVEVVEDSEKNIARMSDGQPFLAIKSAVVQARPARAGEIVDTRPRVELDGRQYTMSETIKTVTPEQEQAGAMVVTNPDGEEYLIRTAENFESRYEKTSEGYVAIDNAKLFVRSNGNYTVPCWGSEQVVLKGSYFCVQDKNDIYGITNMAFDVTYVTGEKRIQMVEEKIKKIKAQRNECVSVE